MKRTLLVCLLGALACAPAAAAKGPHAILTTPRETAQPGKPLPGAAAFRFTMVFPREGPWKLLMFAGNRRFAFPAVQVGGAQAPQGSDPSQDEAGAGAVTPCGSR